MADAICARWPITYCGIDYDRGQIMTNFGESVKDEQLERLAYVTRGPVQSPKVCAECGAEFVDDRFRTMHGNARHNDRARRELSPREQDALEDQHYARLAAEAPLNIEKTLASLTG